MKMKIILWKYFFFMFNQKQFYKYLFDFKEL